MADNEEQVQETAQVGEETTAATINLPEASDQVETETNGDSKPEGTSTDETPNAEEEKTEEAAATQEEEEDDDEDERKLFVGGLSWHTTSNGLKEYMTTFGEVQTCTIKMDNKTGKSRCFGFVIFTDAEAIQKVEEGKPHKLDGKEIDAKKAEPQRKESKLFVGGVKPETTDDQIKEYFGKYGKIEKLERPFDQRNDKPKGFCFVTFTKDGPIGAVTKSRYHDLDGKKVECKHAEPPAHGFGGGRGGRGGGRGMGGGWNQGGFGGGFGGYGGYNQGGYGGFNPGFGGGGGGFGGQGAYGGGYGQGFGGGFNQPFAGGSYGGNFGGGGGGGYGGGGYGFGGQQQSGYGKSGRGRHMNNFKPY